MQQLRFGIITTAALLLASPVWAQSAPQPPASWVDFQQQENAKRAAFYQQLKADREAFLAAHPEAKAYLDQMRATAAARRAAWKAAHQK